MSNQLLQWPEICSVDMKIQPMFGGHNYIFRQSKEESFIFIASEKRLPYHNHIISGLDLPKNVTVDRTTSGGTKIIAKNPFDILEVILAAKQV